VEPKIRLLVINNSSVDMIDRHRAWLESQGVQVIADPSFLSMQTHQLEPLLDNVHAVIGPSRALSLLPEHMDRTPSLQAISLASSGYEWVDIDAATERGIVVTNATVEEGSEAVADHTIGMLLAVVRQIPYHHQLLQAGQARRGMGSLIWRKTLGIIGLGNIGSRVARRALNGFDMKVLAAEIRPDYEFMQKYGIELVSLDELLARADFVSLHVRLNPDTEGMIGARELGLMKPSAFLINTARQKLVDEAVLTEAILSGRIAGAAIDDPPEDKHSQLLQLPNVVYTPHIGNRAIEGVDAVCLCAYQNAIDVVRGRRPRFILNPQVYEGDHLRAPRPERIEETL
jgi:phosphoglycerate dehydrogenase-like enzyme